MTRAGERFVERRSASAPFGRRLRYPPFSVVRTIDDTPGTPTPNLAPETTPSAAVEPPVWIVLAGPAFDPFTPFAVMDVVGVALRK